MIEKTLAKGESFYIYIVQRNELYSESILVGKSFWQELNNGAFKNLKLDGALLDLWENTKKVGLQYIEGNLHEFEQREREPNYGAILPFGYFACMYISGGQAPNTSPTSRWFEKKIVISSQADISNLIEQEVATMKCSVWEKIGVYVRKSYIQLVS